MRKVLAATIATAALTMAACGSGDGDTESADEPSASGGASSSTPTEEGTEKSAEAARQVVVDYGELFIEGKGEEACALLTEEYQRQQVADAAEFADGTPPQDCPAAMKAGVALAKAFGYDPSKSSVGDASVDGDTATVIEEVEEPFEDTIYTLNWVGDTWLIASDDSAAEATADTASWLENWCQVQPGMTVDEAVDLMGEVTGDFREDGGGQVEWSADRFSFTAFLEAGKIVQLDNNESDLTAQDKAALACEPTRR